MYGYHTPDPPQLTPVLQTTMYSVHDPEVKLEDIAMATPVMEYTLPHPPSVKGRYEGNHSNDVTITSFLAKWMSVEGVAIGNVEPGEEVSSQDHIVINKITNEVSSKFTCTSVS